MGLIVLGIDPGLRITGFGLIHEMSGQLTLIDAGTIRTTTDAEMDIRLGEIFFRLVEIITRHQPAISAIENVFQARNPASALKLGQARGVAIAACAQGRVPVFSYEPTMVKKSIVGVGRAEKSQVAFMVARLLGMAKAQWAVDASDALAVAICHVNQQRLQRMIGAGGNSD